MTDSEYSLLAERIEGYEYERPSVLVPKGSWSKDNVWLMWEDEYKPDQNIDQAMALAEAMRQKCFRVTLYLEPRVHWKTHEPLADKHYGCKVEGATMETSTLMMGVNHYNPDLEMWDDTLPEAIAAAALAVAKEME